MNALDRMDKGIRSLVEGVKLRLEERTSLPIRLEVGEDDPDSVFVRVGDRRPVEVIGSAEGWTRENDWALYFLLIGIEEGLEIAGGW